MLTHQRQRLLAKRQCLSRADRCLSLAPPLHRSDELPQALHTLLARYDMTLQDVLAVYATAKGLPTLTGDMRQTTAAALSGPLSGSRFGRAGTRLRLFATGLGTLTNPVTLNAQLEIAGNWSIE